MVIIIQKAEAFGAVVCSTTKNMLGDCLGEATKGGAMEKWAESTEKEIELQYLKQNYDISSINQMDDNKCDGLISKTYYHDGTVAFTQELIRKVLSELLSTNTKEIGKMILKSDFVICDMNYGKRQNVQRDTVTVGFKFT